MSIIQGTSKSSAATYEIDQSIRFNDDDSASLTRTPGSAGNRRTFTFSCWVKRANLTGANQPIFSAGGDDWLMFLSAETLGFNTSGSNYRIVTSQLFRDPGAWFHLVLRVDTTNATAGDRLRLYINGSEVTDFGTDTNPTLNFETAFNNTGEHRIGKLVGASQFFDGYLSEINHVDGSSLAPTEFGETNSDTGQWVPKKYTNAAGYGTNGFYLKGQDSSALGDDTSGNGNDFTSSGLAAADQVTDSPTDNQSTLNPLWAGATLSDGNLVATASGNSYQWAVSTFAVDDGGKHVCEFQKSSGTFGYVGLYQLGNHTATTGNNYGYFYNLGTGEIVKNATLVTDLGAGAANSLMRLEYDSATDTLEIFDDGSSIHSATTGLSGHNSLHFGCAPYASGTVITATFSPLSGTPTTGFNELTATNLDDPTIADPGDYFNTVLYTGNGATGQSITGVGFQPDWVWTKIRSPNAYSHQLFDAVRGAGKNLQSNNNNAEGDLTSEFLSFDSDGFTIDDVNQNVNESGSSYVAWNWKANGSGSSNGNGSISATVSANTTAGFSVGIYTGNGTDNATVGHGLSGADMVWVKRRNTAGNWRVYEKSSNKLLYLDLTNAGASPTEIKSTSSTVFTLGSGNGFNGSGDTHVFYAFQSIPGFSKIGSFEGNSNADGTFVYTGFKPAFILTKNIDTTDQWGIRDAVRNPSNVTDKLLNPNASSAETTSSTGYIDILSNGFKARSSDSLINSSTIIYYAVAESPFKTSTAR